MSLERLEQLAKIEQLNAAWCRYLDRHDVLRLVDLYTEDAYYAHDLRVSRGRSEIEKLFSDRKASGARVARHIQTGLIIEFKDDEHATGVSTCLTFAGVGAIPLTPADPYLVADFDDQYRLCEDGRWRFSSRTITRIFQAAGNIAPIGVDPES